MCVFIWVIPGDLSGTIRGKVAAASVLCDSNHLSARRETACSQASIVACFKEKLSESPRPQASLHFTSESCLRIHSGNSAATVLRSLLSLFRLCPDLGTGQWRALFVSFLSIAPLHSFHYALTPEVGGNEIKTSGCITIIFAHDFFFSYRFSRSPIPS